MPSVFSKPASLAFAACILALFLRKLIRSAQRYGGLSNAIKSFLFGHERFPVAKGYIPIIGHLICLFRNVDRLWDWQVENILPHGGKPVAVQTMGNRLIMLTDPRHVKQAWTVHFEDAQRQLEVFNDIVGNSVVNSDGAVWKHKRKVAASLFSMRHLKCRMYQDFDKYARKMVLKIKELMIDHETIDIQDMFMRLTMDGFFTSVFGVPSNNIDAAPEFNEFGYHMDRMLGLSVGRVYSRPLWKLEKFLGISDEKLISESTEFVRATAQQIVNDRMKQDLRNAEFNDLLSLFLKEKRLSGDFSDKDIIDMCVTFMIAGRDTTAASMSWVLFELCKNPECLKKMIEEMNSIDELTYERTFEMEYTEKVVLETGRIHTVGATMMRVATKDIPLSTESKSDEEWIIRKGDLMLVCNYVMARAPYVWDNPLKFDPDRWTNGLRTFDASQYTSFNLGKRICLGRHVALLEMKVALWHFFRNFTFDIDPKVLENVGYCKSFALEIANGLPITVQEVRSGENVSA